MGAVRRKWQGMCGVLEPWTFVTPYKLCCNYSVRQTAGYFHQNNWRTIRTNIDARVSKVTTRTHNAFCLEFISFRTSMMFKVWPSVCVCCCCFWRERFMIREEHSNSCVSPHQTHRQTCMQMHTQRTRSAHATHMHTHTKDGLCVPLWSIIFWNGYSRSL